MKEEKIRQLIDGLWSTTLASRKHIDEPRRAAGESALSHHQVFCLDLLRENGDVSMSELAAQAGVSNQQLTRIVNELVNLGCAERYPSPTTRRVVFVKITDKGNEILHENLRLAYEYAYAKLDRFTEAELDDILLHFTALQQYWLRLKER